MVSPNPGILFTAFLVPSNQDEFVSYRQDPNFSVMACQEETDEIASHFANRLVGELVPQEFVRTLCSQAPGAMEAGAVVADFGYGRFTVFTFNDGPFPNNIKDLPKLNIVLSIAPQAVDDPSTLPIIAASQGVFNLMRSLRSFNAAVYVKTTSQLIWTLDTNMPDTVNDVSRIVRVHNNGNNPVASSEPLKQEKSILPQVSIPSTESIPLIQIKDARMKSLKRNRIIKISREALILGKRAKFSKDETACLEEAFLENFLQHEEGENEDDRDFSSQKPKNEKADGITKSVSNNVEKDMKEKTMKDKVKDDEKVEANGEKKDTVMETKNHEVKDVKKNEEKVEVKYAKNDTVMNTKKHEVKNEAMDEEKVEVTGENKNTVNGTKKDEKNVEVKGARKDTVMDTKKDEVKETKNDAGIVVKGSVAEKDDTKISKRKEKALTKKEMKDLQAAMDILTNLENM